jgi:NADPH2 dehydrogenase
MRPDWTASVEMICAPDTVSRFCSLDLSGRLTLANRVVVPPMASGTAASDGIASTETIRHYGQLAASGAGLTFVEYTFVHYSGRSEPNQLGLTSDAQAAALAAVAATIRAQGSVPGIQLTHAGGKTRREWTDGRLMGPSGIAVPVKDQSMEPPDAMSESEIADWIAWFTLAAQRAAAAGFAVIELHAAHGYGLNQWLSPFTNKRRDRYGGSLKNRARLLLQIVRSIRSVLPDVVLSVRMPGRDFLPDGLTQTDAVHLARWLIATGVGIIDVSSGLDGWRRPPERTGQGYLVPEAAYIQQRIDAPVIGVGGITDGTFIDSALRSGWLSLAAVGRAILENAQDWHATNMQRPCSASLDVTC